MILALAGTGCVDTMPFVVDKEADPMLFIECELKASGKIEAFVSYPRFVNAESSHLPAINQDDIKLTISEFHKDIVLPFIYDQLTGRFLVNHEDFSIRSGKHYILKGSIKGNDAELQAMVETPGTFPYDSIIVIQQDVLQNENGTLTTKVILRMFYNRFSIDSDQFVHFTFYEGRTGEEIQANPLQQRQNFFRLSHIPGVLWQMNRVTDANFVDFELIHTSVRKPDSFRFRIKNTTKSYYDYHKFKSNAPAQPSPSSNPAIAGFNIVSKAGYGSLSSSAEEEIIIDIK